MGKPIEWAHSQKAGVVAYQLCDNYGQHIGGAFLAPPGLDLASYVPLYRAHRYAEAEAAGDDHCFLGEEEFFTWLIDRGVIQPIALQQVTVNIDNRGEHAYVPKHWPECPECQRGRGEEHSGEVLHSLNRWKWHRKCTECGHIWDHQDYPHDSSKPMLEDDGRYTPAGCVPYSLSQAGGVPFERVLPVCRAHGWSETRGMTEGVAAALVLGISMEPTPLHHVPGPRTLRRVLDSLPSTANYILQTNGHWLAVVRGENRDTAGTGMTARVQRCWMVTA